MASDPRRQLRAMLLAVVGLGALYVGSTTLTPLYPIYQRAFGLSQLAVTEIYAIYVIGNLAVLFLFGRLSDQLGRRPVALAGLAVSAASAICFRGGRDRVARGGPRAERGSPPGSVRPL